MTPQTPVPRAPMPHATRALGVVAALGLLLGACAPGTHAPVRTHAPTKVVARAGDSGVCGVVSPAEFTQVAGALATQVNPGTTDDSLTGLQEVFCIYVDASTTGQTIGRGTINYEVAADTHAATAIFQRVRQAFTQVDSVRGIGDAAFAGTPPGASGGTGLVVLNGHLLLYLSVGGDQHTVEAITARLASLVLSRVA